MCRRKLKLLQDEQALSTKRVEQLDAAQTSAEGLQNVLQALKGFLLETHLRIEDGTLLKSEVPPFMETEKLSAAQVTLGLDRQELQRKEEEAGRELERNAAELAEAQTVLVEAEESHASARNRHAEQIKLEELKQLYLQQSPEDILALNSEWQEERIWLQETLSRSFGVISNLQVTLQHREEELGTRPPVRDELTEESLKAPDVEALIRYYTQRMEALKTFQATLESSVEHSETCKANADFFAEHLFKMWAVAGAIEQFVGEEKIATNSISEHTQSEELMEAFRRVSTVATEMLQSSKRGKDLIEEIKERVFQNAKARNAAVEKQAQLKNDEEFGRNILEWEAAVKRLSTEKMLQRFEKNALALPEAEERLNEQLMKLEEMREVEETAKKKLGSITDPLFRSAQPAIMAKRNKLLTYLYKLAGLNAPTSFTSSVRIQPGASVRETDADIAEENDQETSDVNQYQNLLLSRILMIEDQQKKQTDILTESKILKQRFEQTIDALAENRKRLLQHYANAFEIKKRVGRGEINSAQIPPGIAEALKKNRIVALETMNEELLSDQTRIAEEIEQLKQLTATPDKLLPLLINVQRTTGQRVDQRLAIGKLKQDFPTDLKTLPEVKQKTLKRKATRRADSEDRWYDIVTDFTRSDENTKTTGELLKAYYLELIMLEAQKDNYQDQINTMELFKKNIEVEQTAVAHIVPLLQKRVNKFKQKEKDELAHIQTGIQGLETESPPLFDLDEADRAERIYAAGERIIDHHANMLIAGKWLSLFKKRLTSTIRMEVNLSQEELERLAAEKSTVERRILTLTGRASAKTGTSTQSTGKIVVSGMARNSVDRGEIHTLRKERLKNSRQAAIQMLIKIASIVLVAIILIWFMNQIINYIEKSRNIQHNSQKKYGTTFLRTSLQIAISATAIIMVLNLFGFNIVTIMAGLGIGGLAIAMAARETIANLLGGLTVFIEKPFEIGDWIRVGDRVRIGERKPSKVIGMTWRTTRILTPFDTVVSIPNHEIAESVVENFSLPNERYKTELTLDIDPSYPVERVKGLLSESAEESGLENPRVEFIGTGEWSAKYSVQGGADNYTSSNTKKIKLWNNVKRNLDEAGMPMIIQHKPWHPVITEALKPEQNTINAYPLKEKFIKLLDFPTQYPFEHKPPRPVITETLKPEQNAINAYPLKEKFTKLLDFPTQYPFGSKKTGK